MNTVYTELAALKTELESSLGGLPAGPGRAALQGVQRAYDLLMSLLDPAGSDQLSTHPLWRVGNQLTQVKMRLQFELAVHSSRIDGLPPDMRSSPRHARAQAALATLQLAIDTLGSALDDLGEFLSQVSPK